MIEGMVSIIVVVFCNGLVSYVKWVISMFSGMLMRIVRFMVISISSRCWRVSWLIWD